MIIKILDKFGITIVKPLVKRMCPGFEVGARLVVLPALSSGHCSESKNKKFLILWHAYQCSCFQKFRAVQMKYWIFKSHYGRVWNVGLDKKKTFFQNLELSFPTH